MNLVDANVLIYAVNESDPRHAEARRWLDGSLHDGETVAFSWVVLLAFLRLVTKVGLFPQPLTVAEAWEVVNQWLGAANSVVLDPGPRHASLLSGLLLEVGAGGNLVNDAHLAALALEHDAGLVSYDTDFARFGGVRLSRPA